MKDGFEGSKDMTTGFFFELVDREKKIRENTDDSSEKFASFTDEDQHQNHSVASQRNATVWRVNVTTQ